MSAEGSSASLRQLFEVGTVAGLSDAQLLQRFLTRKDEAAFEALVRKHGPMVLSVCRRRLSDPNDVDDAFQATFLVLIRRAREIQDPARLPNWLYGVAHKVADRARINALKRRDREGSVKPMPPEPDRASDLDDLAAPLHDEIRALPDRYRSAIVVCFLEGRTHEEAARDLGWPVGTVKGRLARAKDLLRKRLVRRGFSVPAGVLSATIARDAAGSVPPALLRSTVQAALQMATGDVFTAAAVSSSAGLLAQEVGKTMIRQQIAFVVLGVAALGLLGGGAGVYALQGQDDHEKAVPTVNPKPPETRLAEAPTPPAAEAGNDDRIARTPEVLDARSRLAHARTRHLIGEYKRLKAYSLRSLYAARMGMGSMVVRADDDETEYKLKGLIEQIKVVSENPADQIAATEAWLRMINEYETQAREALPENANAALVDFEIDRAEAEVWLAELRARNPGVEPASWKDEASRTRMHNEPAQAPENPEDQAQDQVILEALRTPIPMPFDEPTSLSDLMNYVRERTRSESLPDGIPIYVAPETLTEWGEDLTLDTPSFQLNLEDVPLKTTLQLLMSQRNLAYEVRRGLLTIKSRPSYDPPGDESEQEPQELGGMGNMGGAMNNSHPDWSHVNGPVYPTGSPLYGLDDVTKADQKRSDQVRAALRKTIPMPFPMPTPLKDVLTYLKDQTKDETFPSGLPIYVDPLALDEHELTPESPIRMALSGVQLQTTLDLLLKQLGLVHVVRQGVILVTSPESLKSTPNPREESEFVQQLRSSGGWMGGMGGGMGGGFR